MIRRTVQDVSTAKFRLQELWNGASDRHPWAAVPQVEEAQQHSAKLQILTSHQLLYTQK